MKQTISMYKSLIYPLLFIMILYSLLRIGFTLVNISQFEEITFSSFLYMMYGGLRFDLVAVLYLNILYILALSLPVPFKFHPKYLLVCKYIFISTNTLGVILNLIDFIYYKFTLKRTTASIYHQFSNEQNKLKLVIDFITETWLLLIVLFLIIWFLKKIMDWFTPKIKPTFNVAFYLLQTLFFFLIAGLTVIGVRGGWLHSTRPITLSNAGEYVNQPKEMNIVLNTPFCVMKTIGIQEFVEIHYFDENKIAKIFNPIHTPHPALPFKKLNVVLLIIESLGKEHIGALNKTQLNGTYKGYTPFIDSLVANSYTFKHSYANGRKSIDALPSILSSIPSIKEPFVLTRYVGNDLPSLPRLLKNEGYQTAFFHGAANGSMGFLSYTHLIGVDHYFGKTEYGNDADFDGMWGIWDEPFMQFMANKINTFKPPFFSAFFSVSSHHPFKVPKKYKGVFPKGPLPVQEPIGYTDMSIRKFFQTASKMPWYKNTLFVLCADHATVSYLDSYKTECGYYSIPILFYIPGSNLKGMSDKLIQQIDIMPSILHQLNYPKPYFSFGFDAFDTNTANFVVNNNGANYDLYFNDYLFEYDDQKNKHLFNIITDPLNKNDLSHLNLPIQAIMETKLKAFIQQYNNRIIHNKLKTN